MNAYIVSAVRTAVGKAPRGSLHHVRADELGAAAVKGALEKVPELTSELIDDVVMGCAMPEAEQGFNLGRLIALRAGLPEPVAGVTVNRLCSSGLQAIAMAVQAISFGSADVMIAGGAESMSQIPMGGHHWLPNADLFTDIPGVYLPMGITAEKVAERFNISRADQDAFALRSHQKALDALENGRFKAEIVPVTIREVLYLDGKPQLIERIFDSDEGIRADTTLSALADLKPVFHAQGSVTAGTSSQMSDGGAATVVMSEKMVEQLGIVPMAKMLGFAAVGVDPEIMGIGPVAAIPKVLQQVGLSLSDIGLIELNEAFAAQSLAVIRELGLNEDLVNVNGGAIALGHPLGCSGAKLTATLLHEMQRRGVKYGIVTMCVGGGMGAAAVFENLML